MGRRVGQMHSRQGQVRTGVTIPESNIWVAPTVGNTLSDRTAKSLPMLAEVLFFAIGFFVRTAIANIDTPY